MSTPSGPTNPASSATPVLRSIIWHAATGELPGELLSSLSRRIGRMIICTDPYSALAEACLIERLRRIDLANGSPAPAGGILVLVQPAHLAGLPQVVEALGSYAPSIALWRYDRGANPKLRAVVEADVIALTARKPAPATATPTAPPAARPAAPAPVQTRPAAAIAPKALNGSAHAAPAPQPPPAARPSRNPSLLTEEELTMLLSPDGEAASAPVARHPGPARRGGRPA